MYPNDEIFMAKHISGIYRIVCIKNGRCYYGSSKNINYRWAYHKHKLKVSCHPNKVMQRTWDKYGESSFKFELLETTPINDLLVVEQKYLDAYVGTSNCMNIRPLALGGISKKEGLEVGLRNKGKIPWNKGKTGCYTEDSLQLMRDGHKGNSPWNKGKTGCFTKEHLKLRSEMRTGRPNPSRAKITADEVIEIRKEYATGAHTVKELGTKYKIHPDTVRQIIVRKTWKHVI